MTVVRTAAEALVRLRSPEIDFEQEAILFDPLPDVELVPISRSRIHVHRGFITVSAEAPGRALLVLPVEFSRCLEFSWESSNAEPPLALRANLDQTAIRFSGRLQARLALHAGPLVNGTCRLRVLQEAPIVSYADCATDSEAPRYLWRNSATVHPPVGSEQHVDKSNGLLKR